MKHIFRKLNIRGLRFRIWGYFFIYAAVIMAALWLLQIVLLNSLYTQTRMAELQKTAEAVAASYGTETIRAILSEQPLGTGITVRIYDKNGAPVQLEGNPPGGAAMAPGRNDPAVTIFLQNITASKDGRVSYVTNQPRTNASTLVYGLTLTNTSNGPLYLYAMTQINVSDSPAALLQAQLVIVMAIALMLSIGISVLIASRLSRPITKLTESTKQLAAGKYDVRFETGGYSEISELASTLNYATEELSKTNSLQRELIANVSHDLRTPLTLVKMYAELIRDVSGDREDKRNAHTQVIIEETDRLSALITDILDLSKIQSGTVELTRGAFDLGEKAKVILNRFRALTEREGYQFHFTCTGDATVCADETKIEQVIYNLIGNAVNFTGDDKTVTIRIERRDAGVLFEVCDTGPGISEEERPQIWERYYKADKSHKRAIIGTGLGLSIVKGILEAHGAQYGVRSTPGAGSTFWFML